MERTKSHEPEYASSLIEASLDPLIAINTEGKITDMNQATLKITGLNRDLIHGSDFSDYFTAVSYTHLRAHETVLDLVCRLLLEKKKKTYQYIRLYHILHTTAEITQRTQNNYS